MKSRPPTAQGMQVACIDARARSQANEPRGVGGAGGGRTSGLLTIMACAALASVALVVASVTLSFFTLD